LGSEEGSLRTIPVAVAASCSYLNPLDDGSTGEEEAEGEADSSEDGSD